MNLIKFYFPVFFIAGIVCSYSCSCDQHPKQPKKEVEVNTSDIQVDIIRFEKELFACDPNNLETDLSLLQQKYPVFYTVFFN